MKTKKTGSNFKVIVDRRWSDVCSRLGDPSQCSSAASDVITIAHPFFRGLSISVLLGHGRCLSNPFKSQTFYLSQNSKKNTGDVRIGQQLSDDEQFGSKLQMDTNRCGSTCMHFRNDVVALRTGRKRFTTDWQTSYDCHDQCRSYHQQSGYRHRGRDAVFGQT